MKKSKTKMIRCSQCKQNIAMGKILYRARLEDIPDGDFLALDKNLCENCLNEISEQIKKILLEK